MGTWSYETYLQKWGSLISEERFLEIINSVDYQDKATMDEAWFLIYSEGMGGDLDKKSYLNVRAQFEKLTVHAYVLGESEREESWRRFSTWLHKKYPGESAIRILDSVDTVTAYT